MSQIIIKANPTEKRKVEDSNNLRVSEFFCDTIQGEGIYSGHPASFLRLQGCTLDCSWCDTKEVWKHGNPYTFDELFVFMEHPRFDLIRKFKRGQHLVFTGGSPLLQQWKIVMFVNAFIRRYDFKPFIEIENEAILDFIPRMVDIVDCWNNSPKLQNSNNSPKSGIVLDYWVIQHLSELDNSWFKFVINNRNDWQEIDRMIQNGIIKKEQVILMPQATTREELNQNTNLVLSIAIENNVRFSSRMQVSIWDLTTGV